MSSPRLPIRSDFVTLEPTEHLPRSLRSELPDILWLPEGRLRKSDAVCGEAALVGRPIDPDSGRAVSTLASVSDSGPTLHFDAHGLADDILLERYHPGLEATIDMRLPFNYSRAPRWVKNIGLQLRSGAVFKTPPCPFPSGDPSFVVDWLGDLAEWAGDSPPARCLARAWPGDFRAAACITHDVDTEWR